MPGRGRGFGGPTSGRGLLDRIKDRFLGGVEGRVYSSGGDGIRPDRNGVRGGMLDGTDVGGIFQIRNRGGRPSVEAGHDVRRVGRAAEAITGQVGATAQGIDDIRSGRYDVGRAEYRDAPHGGRRDDPAYHAAMREQELKNLQSSGEQNQAAVPHAAEQYSDTGATLARLDDAQNKLNNGPLRKMDDASAVRHVTDKMKVENPGAYELYTHGGFVQTKAGLNEFFNYSREVNQNPAMRQLDQTFAQNPEIGRSVIEQWRLEVGNESTSPAYKGDKRTILDHLGQAAQDPDRLDMMQRNQSVDDFWDNVGGPYSANKPEKTASAPQSSIRVVDPNDAIAVKTPDGSVSIPKTNPSAAKYEPAKQPGGFDVKALTTDTILTSAELNKLTASGLKLDNAKLGQEANAPRLITDASGKIYGGYSVEKAGDAKHDTTYKFLTREQLETEFSAQKVAGVEKMQMDKLTKDNVQVAATNAPPPAIDPLTKPNNLALNASPPTTGMG